MTSEGSMPHLRDGFIVGEWPGASSSLIKRIFFFDGLVRAGCSGNVAICGELDGTFPVSNTSGIPEATQEKLQLLLSDVHKMVTFYVSISSLLFMASAVVISILRAFNFCRDLTKRRVSSVLESEAYRAESSRSEFGNMAVA
jgi:hypothetical protein